MKIEHICAAAPGTRLIVKDQAGRSASGKTRFRTVPVCAWASPLHWEGVDPHWDGTSARAMTPGLGGVLVVLDPDRVVGILMPGETLKAWADSEVTLENARRRFFISASIEIADGAASAKGAR